ncbi:MAG TPA: UbiA family prenyltransferase [Methanoregulaceae archaeon]|nr:UbiA family prenyltransferase [Methanoregulaceae archaeon]
MAYSFEEKIGIFPFHEIGVKDRILEKLHSLVDIVAFSSLILAFTGGFGIYASCYIEGVPWFPALGVIMTLVSFSVYNLNRKTDEQEDEINHKKRYLFTKKFEKYLFYGALLAYAAALLISGLYGVIAVLVTCIPLISGIFYSEPILPARCGYRRLKEIPVIKNILVAGAWAATITLLPVSFSSLVPTMGTLITGVFFFSCVFIGSVLPDIRDLEGDIASGITTVPVLIGIPKTTVLLSLMASVTFGIIFISGVGHYSPGSVLLLCLGIFYMLFCILSMERLVNKNIICDILGDCVFIILGIVTFILIASGMYGY